MQALTIAWIRSLMAETDIDAVRQSLVGYEPEPEA